MLQPDEMTKAMSAVRDQLIAAATEHEREAHAGRPCMSNRASAIAHLAHSLGVRGKAWNYAQDLLAEYDANCPGCGHLN